MITLVALALLQGTIPPIPVGITVAPETVTVGDHVTLRVTVRAPKGARITFPVGPDSGQIEAVDPVAIATSPETTVVMQTASYVITAWEPHPLTVPLGDVTVTVGSQVERVPVPEAHVAVRSVLPRDTSLRIPKPARDLLTAPRPWWPWLLAALAAIGLVWWFLWWWRRRRQREPAAAPAAVAAEREFARIDALALLDAGECGRHQTLYVDAFRDYLAARIPAAERHLTTGELLTALAETPRLPMSRIEALLVETDLVKFAQRGVTRDTAVKIAAAARELVPAIEKVLLAAAAAAAAADAAAKKKAEKAA